MMQSQPMYQSQQLSQTPMAQPMSHMQGMTQQQPMGTGPMYMPSQSSQFSTFGNGGFSGQQYTQMSGNANSHMGTSPGSLPLQSASAHMGTGMAPHIAGPGNSGFYDSSAHGHTSSTGSLQMGGTMNAVSSGMQSMHSSPGHHMGTGHMAGGYTMGSDRMGMGGHASPANLPPATKRHSSSSKLASSGTHGTRILWRSFFGGWGHALCI